MTPTAYAQKYKDLGARAAWTAIQAALGVITAEALGIPVIYVPIAASALSVLKSWVAGKVGDKTTVTFR